MTIEVPGLDNRLARGGESEQAPRVGGCSEEIPRRIDRFAESRIAILPTVRLLRKSVPELRNSVVR